MNLNEILNVSNKSAANLNNILKEVKSYNCVVEIESNDRVKIKFALDVESFIEYVRKYDLYFNSVVYSSNKTCELFVCLENVKFFLIIHFEYDGSEYLRKKYEEELEMVEDFLKLD